MVMAEQIKLTATLACWVSTEYSLRDFTDAVAKGNHMAALGCVNFYGPPDREKFSDSTKVGTAEITMTVVSRVTKSNPAAPAEAYWGRGRVVSTRVMWTCMD